MNLSVDKAKMVSNNLGDDHVENYKDCNELCTKEVLMCDDEGFNLIILSEMLQDRGITSKCFESGAEATECFRKRLT